MKEAENLLRNLSDAAISEERFLDASYFYYLQSKYFLEVFAQKEEKSINLDYHFKEYKHHLRIAKIYYAYNIIHNYLKEPFTSHSTTSLFNASRYLANEMESKKPPRGISLM